MKMPMGGSTTKIILNEGSGSEKTPSLCEKKSLVDARAKVTKLITIDNIRIQPGIKTKMRIVTTVEDLFPKNIIGQKCENY